MSMQTFERFRKLTKLIEIKPRTFQKDKLKTMPTHSFELEIVKN